MLRTPSPLNLLHQQTAKLQSQLGPVRDGDVDGIHQARVATRRIRELLPLTAEWHRPDAVDVLADGFRRIGRALGRVRDADVQIALLRYLEARIPGAAPTLVVVRQEGEHRRLRLMRSLIKEFERLDIDHFLRGMRSEFGRRRAIRSAAHRWDRQLRGAVRDRAAAVQDAIGHATGIYFPNRAHRVRIAIKKFRYATEIAAATGLWNAHEIIRELKKGQEVLGDLHDRQSLIDHLPQEGSAAPACDSIQLRLVVQVIEGEAHDLHQQYLRRRPRLLEVAAIAHRRNRSADHPALWPVAAGVAVASSTLVLMRRSWSERDFVRGRRDVVGSPQPLDRAANVTQAS